jgi:hypothetical protein
MPTPRPNGSRKKPSGRWNMYKVTLTKYTRGVREPGVYQMYFYDKPTGGELRHICASMTTWAEDWRWSSLITTTD